MAKEKGLEPQRHEVYKEFLKGSLKTLNFDAQWFEKNFVLLCALWSKKGLC